LTAPAPPAFGADVVAAAVGDAELEDSTLELVFADELDALAEVLELPLVVEEAEVVEEADVLVELAVEVAVPLVDEEEEPSHVPTQVAPEMSKPGVKL
jgi:hypothetical protein